MDQTSTGYCLFCFSFDKNGIQIFSENGKQLNIVQIISEHFWFQVNETNAYPKFICIDCWHKIETFNLFYRSVEVLHREYFPSEIVANRLNIVSIKDEPHNTDSDYDIKLTNTECNPLRTDRKNSEELNETNSLGDSDSDVQNTIKCEVTPDILLNSDQDSEDVSDESSNHLAEFEIPQYFDMTCDLCDTIFDSLNRARDHYNAAHRMLRGYIKCCRKRFSRPGNIREHIKWHLNPNLFNCTVCEKTFGEKRRLTAHMLRHEPDESKKFSCDKCDKKFPKKFLLNKHITAVHLNEGQEFLCNICNKNFKLDVTLRAHMLNIHKRTFEQICEICAKTFKTKQGFRDHLLTHNDTLATRVQCSYCGAWLKNKVSLKTHVRRSHKSSPQKCKFCDKIKPNQAALNSHILVVHTKPSHQCTICDKSFTKPISLTEHIASHTGENLYTCSYCPKMFKSSANMYKHKKQSHPEQWNADRKTKPQNEINLTECSDYGDVQI